MADTNFQQVPQLSTEKFILQDKMLLIIGGAPSERRIPLHTVSADYVWFAKRFHAGYLVPLFFAAASAVAAWKILQGEPSMIRLIIGGVLAFMAFIFPFFMKFAPVEGAAFFSVDGDPLFQLYRPQKSPWKLDEFLSVLVPAVTKANDEREREEGPTSRSDNSGR